MAISKVQPSKLIEIWEAYEEVQGVQPAEARKEELYRGIPGDIKALAQQYGWGDDEVQEALCLHFDK